MSGPAARLKQIANVLVSNVTGHSLDEESKSNSNDVTTFNNPNRLKFQPTLPPGLAVNHTPLNPVNFLLRSATVRPKRVAVIHPAKNAKWTYEEWSVMRWPSLLHCCCWLTSLC